MLSIHNTQTNASVTSKHVGTPGETSIFSSLAPACVKRPLFVQFTTDLSFPYNNMNNKLNMIILGIFKCIIIIYSERGVVYYYSPSTRPHRLFSNLFVDKSIAFLISIYAEKQLNVGHVHYNNMFLRR